MIETKVCPAYTKDWIPILEFFILVQPEDLCCNAFAWLAEPFAFARAKLHFVAMGTMPTSNLGHARLRDPCIRSRIGMGADSAGKDQAAAAGQAPPGNLDT